MSLKRVFIVCFALFQLSQLCITLWRQSKNQKLFKKSENCLFVSTCCVLSVRRSTVLRVLRCSAFLNISDFPTFFKNFSFLSLSHTLANFLNILGLSILANLNLFSPTFTEKHIGKWKERYKQQNVATFGKPRVRKRVIKFKI